MDAFQIDGIRFDNTTNFYVEGDTRGLPQLLTDIQRHDAELGQRNFSLTLEFLDLAATRVTNLTGASSYWNNALHQVCFDYLWNGQIDARILGALDNHRGLDDDKVATFYLSNHDHSHVAWQAGARHNAGALEWYRTQPYAIALLTSPGTPLLENGQEFAEDYWIMEDDQGSNRRVKPQPLHWDFPNDPVGSKLLALYNQLINLRKSHAALRSNNFYPDHWDESQAQFNSAGYGVDVGQQVVIYHRWGNNDAGQVERFIIVLNFSSEAQFVDIPFSTNGAWRDLLNNRSDDVSDYHLTNQRIEPYWGRIYFQ